MTEDSQPPAKARETRVFAFEEFTFDVASGELRKGDEVVRLAPQPATVLVALLEHAGRVVSRDELGERLWPDGYVEVDLGINHCLRQVRRALGDNAGSPLFVETLPRRGYRFIAEVVERSPDGRPARTSSDGKEPGVSHPASRWSRRVLTATAGGFIALLGMMALFPVRPEPPHVVVLPLARAGEDGSPSPSAAVEAGFTFQTQVTRSLVELAGDAARVIGPASNRPDMVVTPGDGSDVDRANDLGGDFVVSGSIGFVEGRPRLFAQLVRLSDRAHLWAGVTSMSPDSLDAFASMVSDSVWATLERMDR